MFGPPGVCYRRTVILKVWGSLESYPPLEVPPSSRSTTVTVAEPVCPGAGSNISVPSLADSRITEGWPPDVNNPGLSLVTSNRSV